MFRTVDECLYRSEVETEGGSAFAKCGLIQEITGVAEDPLCRVERDACEFCCHAPLPTSQEINPVLASLLYALTDQVLARGGVPGCEPSRASAVQHWAEGQLDSEPSEVEQVLIPPRAVEKCLYLGESIGVRIQRARGVLDRLPVFRCHHPNHRETTLTACDHCRDWSNQSGAMHVPAAQVLPATWRRQGRAVRVWSVGVTTAPRRRFDAGMDPRQPGPGRVAARPVVRRFGRHDSRAIRRLSRHVPRAEARRLAKFLPRPDRALDARSACRCLHDDSG